MNQLSAQTTSAKEEEQIRQPAIRKVWMMTLYFDMHAMNAYNNESTCVYDLNM